MDQADLTLRQWLEELASAKSVPAGASLAAASAAAAAALASRMARIAARRQQAGRSDLPDYLASLSRRLLDCSERDVAVYQSWRKQRDAHSAADMIRVPQEIEALCRSAAQACLGMETAVGPAAAEDVRTACEILQACARAAGGIAAANVRTAGAGT